MYSSSLVRSGMLLHAPGGRGNMDQARIEVNVHLTGRVWGRQGDGAEVWEQSENLQLVLGSIPLLFSVHPPLRQYSPAICSAAPTVWMAQISTRGQLIRKQSVI